VTAPIDPSQVLASTVVNAAEEPPDAIDDITHAFGDHVANDSKCIEHRSSGVTAPAAPATALATAPGSAPALAESSNTHSHPLSSADQCLAAAAVSVACTSPTAQPLPAPAEETKAKRHSWAVHIHKEENKVVSKSALLRTQSSGWSRVGPVRNRALVQAAAHEVRAAGAAPTKMMEEVLGMQRQLAQQHERLHAEQAATRAMLQALLEKVDALAAGGGAGATRVRASAAREASAASAKSCEDYEEL
jgi:hypothetical protein